MGVGPSSGLLRKPQRKKTTDDGAYERKPANAAESCRMRYGWATQQGWRTGMEDALCVYDEAFERTGRVLFAVFDGHGGDATSKLLAERFGRFLLERIDEKGGQINYEVISGAFLDFDGQLSRTDEHTHCGSTGTVAIVDLQNQKLYISHVGDSRALIFYQQPNARVLFASKDHRPSAMSEMKRIRRVTERSNSVMARDDRIFVNNVASLNVARAFGDAIFKSVSGIPARDQAVSCDPAFCQVEFGGKKGPIMVFIASDGVWGARITLVPASSGAGINHQVIRFVNGALEKDRDARFSGIVCDIIDNVTADHIPQMDKTTDNIAGILISVKPAALAPKEDVADDEKNEKEEDNTTTTVKRSQGGDEEDEDDDEAPIKQVHTFIREDEKEEEQQPH